VKTWKPSAPLHLSLPRPDAAVAIRRRLDLFADAWKQQDSGPQGIPNPPLSPINGRTDRANRTLTALLTSLGWTIQTFGEHESPRPMAQLAACEPHKRRVILYLPFLRWIAERWKAKGSVPQEIAGQDLESPLHRPIPSSSLSQCVAILQVEALAHEAFHVFGVQPELGPPDSSESVPNHWGSSCSQDRQAIERGARAFAKALILKYVL
jgi:hypothetical protein